VLSQCCVATAIQFNADAAPLLLGHEPRKLEEAKSAFNDMIGDTQRLI
jgi:hypothetical protein